MIRAAGGSNVSDLKADCPRSGESKGRVFLVGAGPGGPGLITRRGLECLRQADAVLYDRLIAPALLEEPPLDAPRICVGKSAGNHRLSQREIEALLIEYARAGRTVVRLKGGDPFIFGRGGEEVEALARAGVPFEVVPGVSSALAVPAAAGIPLTHRGVSDGFAVWTGHRSDDADSGVIDAPTQVILMGVQTLRETVSRLIEAGQSPATPTAVVSWGATVRQRSVRGTLADIAERAEAAGLESPATIVVGEVVAAAARWGSPWGVDASGSAGPGLKPDPEGAADQAAAVFRASFAGKRVALTRPREEDDPVVRALERAGAEVACLPVLSRAFEDPGARHEIRRAASEMHRFDTLLFVEPHALHAVMRERIAQGLDGRSLAGVRIAVVSGPCERAIREYGIVPDLVLDAGSPGGGVPGAGTPDVSGSLAVFGVGAGESEWHPALGGYTRTVHFGIAHPRAAEAIIHCIWDLADESMIDAVIFDSVASLEAVRETVRRLAENKVNPFETLCARVEVYVLDPGGVHPHTHLPARLSPVVA